MSASYSTPGGDPTSSDEFLASPEGPLDDAVLTDFESGTDQLLSIGLSNGLSDPFSSAQGGWIVGSQAVDPFTNAFNAYVGENADSYTGLAPVRDNPNAFTGGQNVDSFTGGQGVDFPPLQFYPGDPLSPQSNPGASDESSKVAIPDGVYSFPDGSVGYSILRSDAIGITSDASASDGSSKVAIPDPNEESEPQGGYSLPDGSVRYSILQSDAPVPYIPYDSGEPPDANWQIYLLIDLVGGPIWEGVSGLFSGAAVVTEGVAASVETAEAVQTVAAGVNPVADQAAALAGEVSDLKPVDSALMLWDMGSGLYDFGKDFAEGVRSESILSVSAAEPGSSYTNVAHADPTADEPTGYPESQLDFPPLQFYPGDPLSPESPNPSEDASDE